MDIAQSVDDTGDVIHSNISCLFTEILVLIFCYLDVRSKGRAAQVCSSWTNAAYERAVWRGVEAKLHIRSSSPHLFTSLVRRGITRVQVIIKKYGKEQGLVTITMLAQEADPCLQGRPCLVSYLVS